MKIKLIAALTLAVLDLMNPAARAAYPSISTTQQPGSAAVGTSIADMATMSGGDNPTGTVTFNLYDNPTASGAPLFTATETLFGGTATSTGYTATSTGTVFWVATYNGDANNPAVSSDTAAEPVIVSPASPAIDTTQQPASAAVGTPIADMATMSGGYNPTGTVTFNLYANPTASGTPLFTDTETLSGGTATSKGYTVTATGTFYWVASYNGDANNSAVSSGTANEPVTICTPPVLTPPVLTGASVQANGMFKFNFTNITGGSFTVFATTNLGLPLSTWSNLGSAVESPSGSGQYRFTDPQATNYSQRFYCVSSP